MANMLYDTGSISDSVTKTVNAVVAIQQRIQQLDPNKDSDKKELQELTSKAQTLDIFMKKIKELEGILVEMMKTIGRKGQA
jgi:prefoldin subunit 5